MDNSTHIVDFEYYCNYCKHKAVDETEDPCNACLQVPARENSHRPERWEEGKNWVHQKKKS